MTIDLQELPLLKTTAYLQGAISPRPIAFVSSVDKTGSVNLSPFSFFNLISLNPPMIVFSPSRRGRDNTTKHTYENVIEVPEVVVNIVSYSMVQQTSLASTDYPKGVDEFVKAGFHAVPSQRVKPPRVAESPVSLECIVKQIIPLGDTPGAGNLVLCQIVLMHINEEILDEHGAIDPFKIDTVARMGGDWYCRANGDAIFKVPKPLTTIGIGVDKLPEQIRYSKILTGNDLGMLGNVEVLPEKLTDAELAASPLVSEALSKGTDVIHQLARQLLADGKVIEAWRILLLTI